jgi:hypothetical protein
VTLRRQIRFDPPIETPLNDGLVLLVLGARRETRGFAAALQIWNNHLIHADDIVIDHARQRDRFIVRRQPSTRPSIRPYLPRLSSRWSQLCRH